jgi:hypothetical protein
VETGVAPYATVQLAEQSPDDPGNVVLGAVEGGLAGAVAVGAARGVPVDPRRAPHPGRGPRGGTLRSTDGGGS